MPAKSLIIVFSYITSCVSTDHGKFFGFPVRNTDRDFRLFRKGQSLCFRIVCNRPGSTHLLKELYQGFVRDSFCKLLCLTLNNAHAGFPCQWHYIAEGCAVTVPQIQTVNLHLSAQDHSFVHKHIVADDLST